VIGEKDRIISHSVSMEQAIPGSRLSVIPDCDHSVLFDRPELVIPEILGFLGEVPPNP